MKTKFFLLMPFLISCVIFGCTKKSQFFQESVNEAKKMTDEEIIEIYSNVGEFHDNALDFIYNELYTLNKNKGNSLLESDLDLTLTQLNGKVYQYIKDSFYVTGLDFTPLYHYDTVTTPTYTIDNVLQRNLNYTSSPTLKTAFDEFRTFVLDTTKNENFPKYDFLIQKYVPLLQSEIEKKAFVASVSVGKNSIQYWDTSYNKWQTLVNDLTGKPNYAGKAPSGPGKDILYADIAGAGTGAVRGAIVGATGGTMIIPGVGTVAGGAACGLVGMLGGAAVGSAGEAVHSLIKKWLKW